MLDKNVNLSENRRMESNVLIKKLENGTYQCRRRAKFILYFLVQQQLI